MKTRYLTAMCTVFAMTAGFAGTAFANGVTPPAECTASCEPAPEKGNNGWGNGVDGDNAGTPKGGTAETKKNNEIPTKFEGKHEGR